MRDARTLRSIALAAFLGIVGVELSAQAADSAAPHAPPTTIRTAPTEAEKSAWRTKLPWLESGEEASTPRLRGRLYHHEYLSRVTPELFRRSATGAAPGIGADPGRWMKSVSRAWRLRQERRLQQSVDQELAALSAARE